MIYFSILTKVTNIIIYSFLTYYSWVHPMDGRKNSFIKATIDGFFQFFSPCIVIIETMLLITQILQLTHII